MNDYRNFADSIFSPEIWTHEGIIPLVAAIALLLTFVVSLFLSKKFNNKKLNNLSFYAVFTVAIGAILVFICGSFLVEGFNQNVATHNIGVKYDDSKLKTSYYVMKDKTVYVRYTDGASQIDDRIKVVFDKNGNEPFIFQDTGSSENFSKIKEAITKSR